MKVTVPTLVCYCASLADRDGVLLMPALGTYLLVLLLI
jgi:hypothetical protein